VLAHRHQQAPGEPLAGAPPERRAEMVDDGLQPRRAAGVACDDVVAEPLGEDHPRTEGIPAPEPAHRECNPDPPAMGRQIGKRPRVVAVDPPRELATIWAGRSGLPRSRDRRHATIVYLHLLDDQPWRQ